MTLKVVATDQEIQGEVDIGDLVTRVEASETRASIASRVAMVAVGALVVALLIIGSLAYAVKSFAEDGNRRDNVTECRADAFADALAQAVTKGNSKPILGIKKAYDKCREKFS